MKNTIAIFLLVCTIFFNVFEAYAKEENKKSIEQIRELAKKGDSKSQYKLGDIYFEGKEVEKDYNEAIKWFRKAAKQGNLDAFIALGYCCYVGVGVKKDVVEAIKWYRKAADQGNADAQFNLGNCYYGGIGVEKDAVEAIKWYRKAADQGNADAQCSLGLCYQWGVGVEKDAAEAIKWYRKAADQGNAAGQYNLGSCYRFGVGVEKDAVEAIKWYRKAADQGNADAQFNLGNCYYDGIGVEKDAVEAIKWHRKAADQGNARAQCSLGLCYQWGIGVEKDAVEAIKWHRKAADQGNADAQCYLGDFYRFGIGVEKDAVEAIKWYRKAADQGNAGGQYNLGSCYRFGVGVEKDAAEAIKWYRKAADQGNASAKRMIDEYEAKPKAAEARRIAEQKAAEARRIAEQKVAEARRTAACDKYWSGIASGINERKTYKDREEYLQTVKSQLLHDNNDGTVLLNEFASEYLPNTFAKYEKAREKSLEIGQNLKEVFKEKLDNTSPLWTSYLKATEKYAGILIEELRLQNDITYHYLLFKVGALSQERLNEIDSKKVCIYLEQSYTYTLDSKVEKIDGVMEFASKYMPETHSLLETFEKEIGETKVQYDSFVSDAEKMSFFKKNSTHPTLVALHYKYKVLASRYNELMQEVSNLQIKHMLLECTGEDLANKDAELGKKHKEFKDSLPDYVKVGSLNRRSLDINDLISSMVKIPGRDYFMQSTEVTQIQWSLFMKNNSKHKGRMLPVEYVSWDDCQEFIKKLNETEEVKKSGLVFRLPTEGEWKYACSARSTGKYGLVVGGKYGLVAGGLEGTLDEMGWYEDNSGSKTHPVGQKKPNAWGLYDMHGNVREWTASAKDDYYRFHCGGSFRDDGDGCETYNYAYDNHSNHYYYLGFRLAASRAEK